MADVDKNSKKIKVWDLPTRLFHWILVIAFAVSSYSAFQDKFGDFAAIHLWSGFIVLALVSWRILWGLFGSETSRFSSFMKSPKAALAYSKTLGSKEKSDEVGHNPLGGYSVLLMVLLLLAQAALGLFASDGMFFEGPLSHMSENTSDITELHETLGYILFGVIGLHILMIIYYALRKRSNLLLPMITGKKETQITSKEPSMRSSVMALLILGLISASLYYQIF